MKQELKDDKGNVFCQVEYWAESHILYANWIGSYLTLEQVKEGALIVLNGIKEYNTPFLLNDNRQLEGTWDEANEWIAEVWMPQAIEAGLLKFAHLLSEDLYAKISSELMEHNAEQLKTAFKLELFESQEEALKWLQGL